MRYCTPLIIQVLECQQIYQAEEIRRDLRETAGSGSRLAGDIEMSIDDSSEYIPCKLPV